MQMETELAFKTLCFFKKLGDGLWPCCVLSCLHMMNWQCRPWFGSAQSGLEQSDLAFSSLTLHT